ncbi:MAG: NAD(P)-binding domain-containing protein [Desulfobacterales bacterium]|nr:NAD(P)-binding domain-containing protein [Desulfobacterales bacterium]MCP4159820.1 NAD(P)-binding domain-containing protein [Deltaproteobacteria bacterium]
MQIFKGLFAKDRPSPSYPVLPVLSPEGESNIKGLYMAGEIAGKPLIKIALNEGYTIAENLSEKLKGINNKVDYDVIVVGAGIAGVAAATKLSELKARVIVIESGRSFQTLRNFTKGKLILAEPAEIEIKGSIPFEEGSIEKTLEGFDGSLSKIDYEIKEYTKVSDIRKNVDFFHVTTDRGELTSTFVLLATGKAGNPRKSGVPGELEYADKIAHFLKDPDEYENKKILIYGGGDVAAEAALALSDNNKVTLATVDEEFIFPKKKNVDGMREKEKQGKLDILMSTSLKKVDEKKVALENMTTKEELVVENDYLFEMIGAEPPVAFFNKIGVNLENKWSFNKIIVFLITCAIVLPLYTWKKGFWPFSYAQGISHLPAIFKHPSFWYSAVYTILMTVFGLIAMKRWSKGWTDTYQIKRFTSLIIFQLLSFFTIECLFAVYLPKDTWWRTYAVNNPFPLLFDSFFNMFGLKQTDLKWIIAAMGFCVTFIIIPIAVRYHGKRFCTWICGCGGLAETLGDRWRHLSQKGERSRKWEVMGTVVLFWVVISALVILVFYNGNTGAAGAWHKSYALIADFWLIAIIPIALYPIYGGKVWCRYWCPLAKYMEYLSRAYGKLKITSNDKCIQCTQCSLYCQVGVDVMAFAKNAEEFSNKETSCIHCGICIMVCPMDVLKFEI